MSIPTVNTLFGLSDRMKERLAKEMIERHQQQSAKTTAEPAKPPVMRNNAIPEEFYRFDRFAGYQMIKGMQAASKQMGIGSPFFKLHTGIANNNADIAGKTYINFANYNYLNLNGHPAVSAAAQKAIEQYGTSVSASRPVAGERPIQRELEQALAHNYGVDDCIVFVSGHATNVTTIGYLFGKNDLILHDALIHNSVLQGIQLSGAKRMPFAHNDWQALDELLTANRKEFERVLIVIEGIYSMDGDYPDLPRFIDIKRRHKAFLMVDEAHSLGILGKTGQGIHEHFGINGKDVDIWMGTLSKTLAGCGGYIAGEKALVEHLKYSAPGFLYSVGLAPPLAAASLTALQTMQTEPERVQQLHKNGKFFLESCQREGINTGYSAGLSVIPAIIGSSAKTGMASNYLFAEGVNVQPIFYPAVEEGLARLRFFISSAHTPEQLQSTAKLLGKWLRK